MILGLFGLLAQSVEQRTENPRVRGSNPRQPTIFFLGFSELQYVPIGPLFIIKQRL